MTFDKNTLGYLSLAFGIVQYAPYLWNVVKGKLRPHIFSYFIWGVGAGVVFAAQVVEKGGPGAWAMGLSTIACLLVAIVSYRRGGDRYITRSDWLAFASALGAILLWVVTNNPLSAIILITFVDALAYYMTSRKAWVHPHEDEQQTYVIGLVKNALSLWALTNYNATTVMNPLFILIANTALITMIFFRRRALTKPFEAGDPTS